jgi:hypothetical protein
MKPGGIISRLMVYCPTKYHGSKMHVENIAFQTNVTNGWGLCTCPDGTSSEVTAKEDGCGEGGELQCTGGVSGKCFSSRMTYPYSRSLDCGN